MGVGRQDVIDYLRALADHPDGVRHREWLFHAAIMLKRDPETIIPAHIPRSPKQNAHDRHGDETI